MPQPCWASLAALPASAQVQLQAANDPQPNEANVLLQDGSTGASVAGQTNTNPPFTVMFTNEQGASGHPGTFLVNSNNTGGQAKVFDGGYLGGCR